MTREGTKRIFAAIINTYPNYKPEDMGMAVDVWERVFLEYNDKDVLDALMAYMKTDNSGFAPVPGQLINLIDAAIHADEPEELQAWASVRKAISNSGYNYREEFEKLHPLVKQAVGSSFQLHAWALDTDFNESVISSNFIRTYRAVRESSHKFEKFSNKIREQIENKKYDSLPDKAKPLKLLEKSAKEPKSLVTEQDVETPRTDQLRKRFEELEANNGESPLQKMLQVEAG